jgi:hypothetical protein
MRLGGWPTGPSTIGRGAGGPPVEIEAVCVIATAIKHSREASMKLD